MNTVDREALAFELEDIMMPFDQLESSGCPADYVEAVLESHREGVPTGFGKHPKYGWFAICSAGQGPVIMMLEPEPE